MLLDNNYIIVPLIRLSLTYDNGVCNVVTIKAKDKIDCTYKKNGEKFNIVGIVTKIGCNFNSSLGTVGTTAYMQIDGSSEFEGRVEYIQPDQILGITVISSENTVNNIVCSVDNKDQRISLIRENEIGVFQYSINGISWKAVSGSQGMSAYECAVKLGFVGTEEEWLASLKGKDGDPGPAGALEIFKTYTSEKDAIIDVCNVPIGKLISIIYNQSNKIDTKLFIRKKYDGCNCEIDCTNLSNWYSFAGYLTKGPIGPKGEPGKSAYETAVDGGYSGTEEEFTSKLANTDVAVTNSYMGMNPKLENTIAGPIDLRIYGFTDNKMNSKTLHQIDISTSADPDNQTIIFPNDIILRSVPTEKTSAKPNIVINNKKYIADCLMNRCGTVGIYRRVKYIENYKGETIISDWISSTGELDMGASVQYAIDGYFEPLDEDLQYMYRRLHTYWGNTFINIKDEMYVYVDYPINLASFIDKNLENKQDKLIAGENIEIDSYNNTISSKGAVFNSSFITTQTVGGIPKGTGINKGDSISDIIQKLLCPILNEKSYIYWGSSNNIPINLDGLEKEFMDDKELIKGVEHSFTLLNQYPVFAYKKHNGYLKSIKDKSGFENIQGWNYFTYTADDDYLIYYSNESLTVTDFKFIFLFK